jgi:DNA (cytosine-5)-methyltransferase 1
MLRHLDLFAGIGGFSLAAEKLGRIETRQFVEIDPDAWSVLRSNFPEVPIHPDIRDYHAERGEFDLITCGFPCTGTSRAGRREGLSHPESALWREGIRILIECRPRFFIIENPEGIAARGLRAVLGGLRMAGYAWEIERVTAEECGAGHRRPRLFIISYPDHEQERFQQTRGENQMREFLQRVSPDYGWLTVKRRSDRPYHGLSVELVRGAESRPLTRDEYTTPTNTPGRIRARYLAGRTVTPAQAAIALQRVLYLHDLG